MAKEKSSKKKEFNLSKEISGNYWRTAAVILGILLILSLAFGGVGGTKITKEEAGEKVVDFAESQGVEATLVEVNAKGSVYEVILSMQDQEVPVYITLDGDNLIPSLVPLDTDTTTPSTPSTPTPTEVPKSDKPQVDLFVMTHCPYGTQAEKGFIAAMKTLKDVADIKIKFVHYFLHAPEEDETPIQICIREEQPDKFLPYLECFLEDGDSDRCLTETGVDTTKLETCKSNGNADSYYAIDSAESEAAGVRGSPTLVINGVQSNAGRDSASYLSGICGAFNIAPEACNTELSSAGPSPGFGYSTTPTTGAATAAQC
jgi:protein-disulfide isomerase